MADKRTTGWVGWIWFAAIMLLVVGVLNLLYGLVAVFQPDAAYFSAFTGNLLIFDVSGWGWVHLILGAIMVLLSVFLYRGAAWARVLTVIIVILNILGQVFWLPAQPFWSIIALVLDVLVLWAVIVHGDEAKAARDL